MSRSSREEPKAANKQLKVSWRDGLRSWREHHVLVAKESFARMAFAPLSSLMTWLVIGIALSLPAGLSVLLGNLQQLSDNWDGAAQISLYLDQKVDETKGQRLANKLSDRDDIDRTVFISREQALAEFRELSGFGDVLDGLSDNPLPAVIVVYPKEARSSAQTVSQLHKELQGMALVEQAELDLEWVQRLYSLMELGRKGAMALAFLLSVGVLLILGNTIKLAIENRREEILVVKLVGATDAFVRRPFLYTGLWYGLGGGIVASLIITIGLKWLEGPIIQLIDLYQSDFELLGLGFSNTFGLWIIGALLGLVGAWFAVARHIHDIKPR